jgi:glyoxylase-like metal-dependent hydrolase (beta-lactamase superfamily II)
VEVEAEIQNQAHQAADNVFTGDLIFYKDLGTARADFPGGSAAQLFRSARKILALPGNTRIWSGHDYPPESREAMPSMTVEEHREQNKHLMDGMSEVDFIKVRHARDVVLAAPRLLHQSLQLNIRGGRLPASNESGQRLLHFPLSLGTLSW